MKLRSELPAGYHTRVGECKLPNHDTRLLRDLLLHELERLRPRLDTVERTLNTRARRGDPERRKTALVAAARHLAVVVVAMLRMGEVWRHDAG